MTNLQALSQEWRRIAKAQEERMDASFTPESFMARGAEAAYTRCADDLEKAVPQWIACSERMPPNGVYVLTCNQNGQVFIGDYRDDVSYPTLRTAGWFFSLPCPAEYPTHWQPLPAPPHPPRTGEGV